VRLSTWAERIGSAVGGFGFAVCFVLFKALVNAGESDHFEETAAERASLVSSVSGNGAGLCLSGAEEVVVETVAVLEAQDERHNGVIKKVLPDVGAVGDDGDIEFLSSAAGPTPESMRSLGDSKTPCETMTSYLAVRMISPPVLGLITSTPEQTLVTGSMMSFLDWTSERTVTFDLPFRYKKLP